ncbi:ABC transporter ATP-binding protein [Lentzea kentuckyensis]|uniref:ABC transporter ATP-binding protein n=1 Tax=Lentzea kentuckyensis TaxID=360086 RepID=UPI001B7FF598|nr:ABC transporter ATP-binding protein [Lentzea kentuckyensis]
MHTTTEPVLRVRGLSARVGDLRLVREVGFEVHRGRTLAVVGESGSGKSITAAAVMGILPPQIKAEGSVFFDGTELLGEPARRRRARGGAEIGYVFQEPMSALHPLLRIGTQMIRPLRHHLGLTRREARDRALDLLDQVGLGRERKLLDGYVHELSGGMRQRVMIAMAISCGPRLLLADEPTTALDPTVQQQILRLLVRLREELDLALVLISHDLGLAARYSDEVLVMYDGRVVEQGPTARIIEQPEQPYTRALIDAAPRLGRRLDRLPTIDRAVLDQTRALAGGA